MFINFSNIVLWAVYPEMVYSNKHEQLIFNIYDPAGRLGEKI